MNKGIIYFSLTLILVIALLLGCSPSSTPAPTSAPTVKPTETTVSAPTVTSTVKPTTTAPAATTAVKPIELVANFGSGSSTYVWAVEIFDPWCNAIEQRSQGRIKFKRYYGSQLFSATDEWNAMNQGAVDVEPFIINAYYESTSPLFGMTQVPFLWENARHFRKGLEIGLEKVLRDVVQEKFPNTQLLYSHLNVGDTQIFYKGNDIKLPEDIKGRKVRVTDAILQNFINNIGGSGVFVPQAEAYTTLQRNVVSAALTQNTSFITNKWYEVTDKATFLKLVYVQCVGAINRKTWDSLPPDLQKLVLDVSTELVDYVSFDKVETLQYKDNINDVLKIRPDFKFMELTPEEMAKWREAAKPTWDYYARLGGIATSQVINIAEETRSEFVK